MATNPLLLEAIALKKCITATYNNVHMLLAPHILYSKFDTLFIDAVALEKNGERPKDQKVGSFHLAGLHDLALSDRHFLTSGFFKPDAEKYAGVTLFMVEPETL